MCFSTAAVSLYTKSLQIWIFQISEVKVGFRGVSTTSWLKSPTVYAQQRSFDFATRQTPLNCPIMVQLLKTVSFYILYITSIGTLVSNDIILFCYFLNSFTYHGFCRLLSLRRLYKLVERCLWQIRNYLSSLVNSANVTLKLLLSWDTNIVWDCPGAWQNRSIGYTLTR